MDEQIPVVPVPPETKKTIRPVWIVIGGAVIVIAALVAFAAYELNRRGDFGGLMLPPAAESLAPVPDVLKDALFVSDTQVYRASGNEFVPAEQTNKPEVDTVLAFEFNKGIIIKNAVVSPNKTAVAFAQQISGSEDASAQAWQVVVADPRTGSQTSLGEGFAAIFLNERSVARVNSTGIIASQIETGDERVLVEQSFGDQKGKTTPLSPNGSLIAIAKGDGSEIFVYAASPNGVVQVTRYAGRHMSFALTNDALFVLRAAANGTEIARLPFSPNAAAEVVYTLPSSLGITDLSF